jgi:hypothetical protein
MGFCLVTFSLEFFVGGSTIGNDILSNLCFFLLSMHVLSFFIVFIWLY